MLPSRGPPPLVKSHFIVLACYYASVVSREQSRFDVLPAIDLVGGQVVRLRQGDFARTDVFSDEPAATAMSFAAAGARWLHIVDLDGARAGEPAQAETIAAILAVVSPGVACEVAGGLRTEAAVDAMLAAGVARAVLGTAALNDPAMVGRLVRRHGPERVVAAIDVRAGQAVGDAWRTGADGVGVEVAIRRLAEEGIRTFEVTAIDRDGLMGGPDLTLLAAAVEFGETAGLDIEIVASGGIRSVADLVAARDCGCSGAIVGRALYDGSLDLRAAIAATG